MQPTASRRYDHLTTRELLAEQEVLRWDLADVAARPGGWAFAPETKAFLLVLLGDVDAELARRRRLVGQPHAPAWPDRTAERRQELADIKARADLVVFIEQQTPTRFAKRGRTLVARCPFPDHRDTTPSFVVWPAEQRFKCFGCQRGGDVFEFARHLYGMGEFHRVVDVVAAAVGHDRTAGSALYVTRADGSLGRVA